ncbi:MAG: diaminopimelate epimerase [Candidatus Competibacteraceae bacterium]|nr:diaminopimelate epimerase [Candidatus Competibacteraceae bacterium]
MRLPFTKMQGLGNDFVVVDALRRPFEPRPAQLTLLADRHYGVGCDQILLVEASARPGVDFRYRIFNADGGEVEQCGNGARCFARFVRDQGLTDHDEMVVETRGGIIRLRLEADGRVSVEMGRPVLEPKDIPFLADKRAAVYPLEVDGREYPIAAVSMGNPHAVLEVGDVDSAPVAELGPAIESHPRFPRRVNAGFMEIIDRGHIRLRVFERGVGETQACGTGACAAVVAGRVRGLLAETVQVALPGGELTINWRDGEPVTMTGPAVRVFEGEIEL